MPWKQRASWLAVAEPERLDANEERFVETLLARSPKLADLASLARRIRAMVREQQAGGLDGWLAARARPWPGSPTGSGATWTRSAYVWINGSSAHFLGAPFGGYKQSGLGREESVDELLDCTQVKNVNVALDA